MKTIHMQLVILIYFSYGHNIMYFYVFIYFVSRYTFHYLSLDTILHGVKIHVVDPDTMGYVLL